MVDMLVVSCFIFILGILSLSDALSPGGKYVCMEDEWFETTVQVREPYQVDIAYYKWCMRVPPRCTHYRKEWRNRLVDKAVKQMRKVPKCCLGFVAYRDECIPHCNPSCITGTCIMPNQCRCGPGYTGKYCDTECSQGNWGDDCRMTCDCIHASYCFPGNGYCHCSTGWTGERCDVPCDEGSYGDYCIEHCNCDFGFSCHHITGDCFISTTEASSTPLESTTEISSTTYETSSSYSTTQLQTSESSTTEQSTTTESSPTEQSSTTESSTLIDSTSTTELSSATTVKSSATDESTSVYDLSTTVEFTSTETARFSTDITTHFYADTTDVELLLTTDEDESKQILEYNKTFRNIGRSRPTGGEEYAKLVATVVLSILGAVIVLLAAAGLALVKHRKITVTTADVSDSGLYKVYGETNHPGKILFNNPTYGCTDMDAQRIVLQTFKPVGDTLEDEIREMLQAHYDHPPRRRTSSTSIEHLYDEIAATVDESRFATFCRQSHLS